MKFVVSELYNNKVEVKLHDDTKNKIRRILFNGTLLAIGATIGYYYINKIQK